MAEKKETAKKPAAKTTATKKTAEKKTAAKPAAKKTTATKTTAAKPAAKKTAEKKPAAKPAEKKPASKKQFVTYRKEDRKWAVTKEGSDKATKLFNTKAEADEYAKGLAKNQGTSVTRQKKDGKFQKTKY